MFQKFDLIIKSIFSKTLPRVILITLLCSIAIWIIIDTYFRKPLPPPIAVINSNISSTSATVNFLTKTPLATCVTLYSFWPLSFQRSCDVFPAKVHSLRVDNLAMQTKYSIFIESGFNLWTKGYETTANDAKIIPYQTLLTKTKDNKLDQSNLLTFTGKVLDQDDNSQSFALVIMSYSGTGDYWSSIANEKGNYSLTIPGGSYLGDVAINTWSENGYFTETQPTLTLIKNTQKVIVQDYE